MKQGTTFTLPVTFEGVEVAEIEAIEFIFKTVKKQNAKPFKTAKYPDNVKVQDGTFLIPFSMEETYQAGVNDAFYLDTRIKLDGVADNPDTNIVELVMSETLFAKNEEV